MQRRPFQRLATRNLGFLSEAVQRPSFQPAAHGIGIVHLGVGAFHRAHQAAYTDTTLAIDGGNWRIAGVNLRSTAKANALSEQDNLYTLIEVGPVKSPPRIIASIATSLSLISDRNLVMHQLCVPETKIISLTVTEKGYCTKPEKRSLDTEHPGICRDLAGYDSPFTVPGLLSHILQRRRDSGAGGLAVLSCDNLPENGNMLRHVVTDFAKISDPGLAEWIDENVAFPSTMVDRITPRTTAADIATIAEMTGLHDTVPVRCEEFTQWMLEDNFPNGRPAWETAGAVFVKNVSPYEKMKLRLLNGSHSLLAYSGHVCGLPTIHDCMQNSPLRRVLQLHLIRARDSLETISGIDFASYMRKLVDRFDNPFIDHCTSQVAMDGSQKMPLRIFEPAAEAIEQNMPIDTFAFATAAWIRYLMGITELGTSYPLMDPLETEIGHSIQGTSNPSLIIKALSTIDGLCPAKLFACDRWRKSVGENLENMLGNGVIHAAETVILNA